MENKTEQSRNFSNGGLVDFLKLGVNMFISPIGFYRPISEIILKEDNFFLKVCNLTCVAGLDITKYVVYGCCIIDYFSS